MVEFGLKLEDNKVSDWSDQYIQYEKLKQILKKCEVAYQRMKELQAKRPEVAEQVMHSYRAGLPSPLPSSGSLTSLTMIDKEGFLMKKELSDIMEEKTKPTKTHKTATMSEEKIPLTALETTTDYGANSERSIKSSESSSLLSRAIEKATSGVSDYFAKSYERQLRDALKDVDKYGDEFRDCLLADIEKVNNFYSSKLNETKERLNVLKESVALFRSRANLPPPPPAPPQQHSGRSQESDDEDAMETPLLDTHRKSAMQVAKEIAKKSTILMTAFTPRTSHRRQSSWGLPIIHDEEEDVLDHIRDPEEKARQVREAESIQRALVEDYRSAKLLHNYAIMNYTGFVKIVKKHDKTMPHRKGMFKKKIKPEKICNEGKEIEDLATRMELLYAHWFTGRNVSEARAQMLPKKGDVLEMDWSQLRLGYRMGMCSILGLWVAWDCVWGLLAQGQSTIGGRTAFPVFRAFGGLVILQWFWGVSVWVWTRYRVNYIYLFDFNPSIVSSPLSIFNDAVDNMLVYLVLMLLYYKAGAHDLPGNFPAGIFPFFLVVYALYQLMFPFRTRLPMWKTIWEVITTPMTSPTFFHGYVGDIFTSMVKIFQDLAWTFFFIFSGDWMLSEDKKESTRHLWSKTSWYSQILIPLLTLLPLWFRFNQCLRRYMDTGNRLPHLANAFKYALSQTVTLFGAFHPLYMNNNRVADLFQIFWMFVFVLSSLYSFFWDVYMDWGLGRPSYMFLGPRLMYPNRLGYYVIIALDLILRFAWVLTLIPPQSGANFALPQYLTAVSMSLELFRRTIWGFLRLENEHRSNTSGFRRVDFVPLHFSTGHAHGYKTGKEHRGFSVLVEVAVVTVVVVAVAVVSVVAAQRATEESERLAARGNQSGGEL